jgi:hypothetical protein
MIRIPSTEERIHTACSLHTGTSLSQEQGEALTHAMTWRDLEDTLHNGRTRHKAPQCDSIDRNHPEQVNPETGSGLMVAKGWEEMGGDYSWHLVFVGGDEEVRKDREMAATEHYECNECNCLVHFKMMCNKK